MGEIYSVCDNLTRCDEKTAEYLQGQVMHVIRIADDLCQLCQKDEMGFRLNCQILDLQELMRYQVQRFSSSFDNNRILVTEEYTADPVHVTADGDRLGQVLSNIFENCLRYISTPGCVWIRVSSNAAEAVMDIEDSGPGVADECLSRVFDRLYRGNASCGTSARGAGLGLAICKEIVEAHGGYICALAGSRGGLCVRLTLPRPPRSEDE